jgi:uncharacterized membrane protein YqaE (UPF0057 family)
MKNDFSGAVLLFAFVLFYLLPSFVALSRGVRRPAGLTILNLLLGWTVLGWIGALIWAVQAETASGTAGSIRQPMYRLGRWIGDRKGR